MQEHLEKQKSNNYMSILKFIILSGIGIFLFMIPIPKDDSITIPIAFLSNQLQSLLSTSLPFIILMIVLISFIMSTIAIFFQPKWIVSNSFLSTLFHVKPIWYITRILAAIFVPLCLYQWSFAPDAIISENTGSMVFTSLLPILFSVFFFAGFLLPLLLNFGLLEFIGTILVRVMRPLFNLPGRSAVDCIASWLGDGTIGVLLTSKQYEDGHYTKREAAVIGTSFSLVSLTFSFVVIETVGLSHKFLPFYATVTLASLIAAIVLPKLPPLSRIPDTLITGEKRTDDEEVLKGFTAYKVGFDKAVEKASNEKVLKSIVINGSKNVLDMWLAVIPVVMAVGTIALIIAEYTPLFKILGLPFVPLLSVLGIPEAVAASQTLMAGFADMLLPSLLASATIKSEMTLFVIAATSVSQLIYLSEVGALLLGSKIPINFSKLFIIFILRTIITLPIIALCAHLIF